MSPDQIGSRLLQAFEESAPFVNSLSDEIKEQMKALVEAQIETMGLVTREEFDALRLSLNRALERITQLEIQITEASKDTE